MNRLKVLSGKIIRLLAYLIIIVVTTVGLALWLYGDKIKNRIIANLNTQINTPVQVSTIDLSVFEYFPYLSVKLNDVEITESFEFSSNHLLKAKSVYLILNPWDLINGNYNINWLAIHDGDLSLKVDRKGRVNYVIFKANEANPGQQSFFQINRLILTNTHFTYNDIKSSQYIDLLAKEISARLSLKGSLYSINYEGDTDVTAIQIGETTYLENRSISSAARLTYDDSTYFVNIISGKLYSQNSSFLVSGTFDMKGDGNIDFKMEGENTTIQNLISLIPENFTNALTDYKSNGDVYFDLELKGPLSAKLSPSIAVHFGCKNATITHPGTQKVISGASFEGFYVSNSLGDLKSAELGLTGLTGQFDGRPFSGNLNIFNFDDKLVTLELKTNISLPSLLEFYKSEAINQGYGELGIDIKFKGRLKDLEKTATMASISSSGQITMDSVFLDLKGLKKPFRDITGSLLFENSDIALRNLDGYLGESHFHLNGTLNNIFSYLFVEKKDLKIDARLQSDFLDLDELLSIGNATENEAPTASTSSTYSLNISPLISMDFDCNVKQLSFRRFNGRDISGNLKVRDQMAMFRNVKLRDAGGTVFLEGFVDTGGNTIEVLTRADLRDIYIDSLFYIFEDFNQDFISYRHLRGTMNATLTADMSFTQNVELIPQSLVADMKVLIKKGELIDFEPMQLLEPYLPDDNLKHLRFADLQNDIHVEGEKVYLPQMQINSNVTNITIGGTHTFDQHIHYKIVAPIVNRSRIDKDEAFGAIEEDDSGIPKIHLLLTGTTDDYKVTLDKEGTKNQVVSNLKKEVVELKEAFRIKQKEKKKTLELEEDEYFDWE